MVYHGIPWYTKGSQRVAENPTFPILSALAYTTGLGYCPTCDLISVDITEYSLGFIKVI